MDSSVRNSSVHVGVPTIRLEGFGAGYANGPLIIGNVSIEAWGGEIVGIHGGNATGKTTFVKGILGLTPRRNGSVSLFGVDVSKMSFEHLVKSFNVSYLPQRGRLFPELTISENLTVAGFDSSSLLDTVAADLHLRADEAVANLSGGEVLRLAITITELRRAQLVFLDEPTDSADKETKRRVLEILKVFRKHGSTVVVVDHDISFLRASCDILGEVKDAMDESLPHGYTIEFCDINR